MGPWRIELGRGEQILFGDGLVSTCVLIIWIQCDSEPRPVSISTTEAYQLFRAA